MWCKHDNTHLIEVEGNSLGHAHYSGRMPSFKKPPLTKLLKGAVLDKPLTSDELSIIASEVIEWEEKARGLGLTEAEIDNIQNDFRKSKLQKAAMMMRWKEKMAFKATLRELIAISGTHKWHQFIYKVCKALDVSTQCRSQVKFSAFTFIDSRARVWLGNDSIVSRLTPVAMKKGVWYKAVACGCAYARYLLPQ